jgi:hypothetical protein
MDPNTIVERLNQIARRTNDAMHGPFEVVVDTEDPEMVYLVKPGYERPVASLRIENLPLAQFFAEARTDVPWMWNLINLCITRIEALEAELQGGSNG